MKRQIIAGLVASLAFATSFTSSANVDPSQKYDRVHITNQPALRDYLEREKLLERTGWDDKIYCTFIVDYPLVGCTTLIYYPLLKNEPTLNVMLPPSLNKEYIERFNASVATYKEDHNRKKTKKKKEYKKAGTGQNLPETKEPEYFYTDFANTPLSGWTVKVEGSGKVEDEIRIFVIPNKQTEDKLFRLYEIKRSEHQKLKEKEKF